MSKVLIVDDDPVQLRLTSNVAEKGGFDFVIASDGEQALHYLREDKSISAMVLDMVMPNLDGMAVLERVKSENIACPVIVQTAHSSLDTIVSAMRQGAVDFFVKPVAPERLIISLRNALKLNELETCVRHDRNKRDGRVKFADIVSVSPEMRKVFALSSKAAKSTIPVLIEGESGAGKEIVARAIQGASDRAGKPFVTVNCGAIPKDLVESTLFGHIKGAFTGASADQKGKFQEADGGTIFLDEIGELPLEAQVKLLRVLQEGECEPVGATKPIKINVRLMSATNRRLLNLTKEGQFREDLFYRLNVFPVYVPPLRDRAADILPLANYFLTRLNAEQGTKVFSIDDDAAELLLEYNWPGNVRQLENAIFRAIVLSEGGALRADDFPQIHAARAGQDKLRDMLATNTPSQSLVHIDDQLKSDAPHHGAAIDDAHEDQNPTAVKAAQDRFMRDNGEIQSLSNVERDLILHALAHHNWHMSHVARALGIGRSTLYRKLKEYDIENMESDAA